MTLPSGPAGPPSGPSSISSPSGPTEPGPAGSGSSGTISGSVRTLGELKQKIIAQMGQKEGTAKYNQFIKLLFKSFYDMTKKAMDRALAAQKKNKTGV